MTNQISRTEEQLRRVALACFVNARDLYEDACLLGKHTRYPRALVLAVIGMEEFVKSVAYTIAALNPDERVRLSQTLKALHYHDIKHGCGDTIEGVFIQTSEGVDCAADMAGFPVASGSYFRETFLALARQGLQGLLPSRQEAKAHAQALNDIAPDSAPSVLKERGLYVDIRDDDIYTPSQLEDWDATSTIIGLEWFLDTFRCLPSVLDDDIHWQHFADTIRQQLF
jgi:hypothetical protein